MYRFSQDLDLTHLTGCTVVQVSHGSYNLRFHLEPANEIDIEGRWRLRNADNEIADEGNAQEPKDAYRTHLLVGQTIRECRVMSPATLAIVFGNGWALEIVDDSDDYETCYISPNIYI